MYLTIRKKITKINDNNDANEKEYLTDYTHKKLTVCFKITAFESLFLPNVIKMSIDI